MIAIVSIAAAGVFVFCTWAIFNHKFLDGIIAKHLLSFGAIGAALTVLDPHNFWTAFASLLLTAFALGYIAIRYRRFIDRRSHPRTPGDPCLTGKN